MAGKGIITAIFALLVLLMATRILGGRRGRRRGKRRGRPGPSHAGPAN